MEIVGLVLLVTGMLLETPAFVLLGAMVLLARAVMLSRDLRRLRQDVDLALPVLSARSSRTSFNTLSRMWSGEGERVAKFLEMLLRRLREASIELKAERDVASIVTPITADPGIKIGSAELSAVAEVLNSLKGKLSAKSYAVGWIDRGEAVVITDSLTLGVAASCVKQEIRTILSDRSENRFGLKELSSGAKLADGITALGYKFSMVFPIKIGGRAGLVWAGYQGSAVPSPRDLKQLSSIADGFESTVQTRSKLLSLDKSLKENEQLNKARDNFIAGVSHDLKTPLHNLRNIILLLSTELKEAAPSGMKEQDSLLELIPLALKNCDLAQEMIEDVMYFSRYQLGRLESKRVEFELGSEITDIVSAFHGSAQVKKIKLEFVRSSSNVRVSWDRKHFRRVISNLLSNAIKYTESGSVKVSLTLSPKKLAIIEVTDSGCGISAENIPHLFEPYRRFTENGDGVGLGLTIVRILSEVNSADLSVASTPNQGSSFRLAFPVLGVVADDVANITETDVSTAAVA